MGPFCLIATSLLILVAGSVLWGLGNSINRVSHLPYITSVPLCPQTDSKLCDTYFGSELASTCSGATDLVFNFSSSGLKVSVKDPDLWIMHNLWGYNISFTLSAGTSEVSEYSTDRNIDSNESIPDSEWGYVNDILPSEVKTHGYIPVYCPYETLITNEFEIAESCSADDGYWGIPFELSHRYQMIKTVELPFSDYDDLQIVFHGLTVKPMNFIDVPEMFLVVYAKFGSILKMRNWGIGVTTVGIALLVLGCALAIDDL